LPARAVGARLRGALLPVMLSLPGLDWEVQSYGLLLAPLALVLAWVVVVSLGRRDHLPVGPLGTAYVLGVSLGLVGARLSWILQRPGEASAAAPELFVLRADELAPLAGVVVAGLVAGLHVMRRRIPVVAFFDVAAPALAAGAMLERLGALLAGTGYGGLCAHAAVGDSVPRGLAGLRGAPAGARGAAAGGGRGLRCPCTPPSSMRWGWRGWHWAWGYGCDGAERSRGRCSWARPSHTWWGERWWRSGFGRMPGPRPSARWARRR
jgi:hypothetical protein